MGDKIRIYGTETCPYCQQAREAYGERAVFINVDGNPEKLEEMLAYSGGKRTVPVIVEGENVTVGFLGHSFMTGGIPLFAVG
jgi:glutaredoxin 3